MDLPQVAFMNFNIQMPRTGNGPSARKARERRSRKKCILAGEYYINNGKDFMNVQGENRRVHNT